MCRPKKMVCWEICFFKKTIACSCRWDILVSLLHWLAWRRTFFAIRELLCSWCLYSPCSVGPLLKPRKCVGLHVLWLVLCLSSFLFLLAQQCFLHHNSWSIVSVSVQCYCYVVYRSTKFCRFNIWTWYPWKFLDLFLLGVKVQGTWYTCSNKDTMWTPLNPLTCCICSRHTYETQTCELNNGKNILTECYLCSLCNLHVSSTFSKCIWTIKKSSSWNISMERL